MSTERDGSTPCLRDPTYMYKRTNKLDSGSSLVPVSSHALDVRTRLQRFLTISLVLGMLSEMPAAFLVTSHYLARC